MHCILLNTLRNLFLFWYKDKLLPGAPEIDAISIPIIQNTLSSARVNIPAALGAIPKHISTYKAFKAAEWKTLLEIYGIPLLFGHLPANALANLIDLYDLWSLSIQHSLTTLELDRISALAIKFVRGYQDIYYRKRPECLSACSINVHWLLHLRKCIEDHGPARGFWSWPLERYVFEVKEKVRSDVLSQPV
jgi:hypothetical protein